MTGRTVAEWIGSTPDAAAPHRRGLHIQEIKHPVRRWFEVRNSDGYSVAIAGDRATAELYMQKLGGSNDRQNH